jgi:hypothetical protein
MHFLVNVQEGERCIFCGALGIGTRRFKPSKNLNLPHKCHCAMINFDNPKKENVTCMKTIKIDDERIGLSLNSKYKTKGPRQEHKG